MQQFCPQPFVWPYPVRLHGRLNISPRWRGVSSCLDERPGSDDLNGINVKYRYEFTDTLGLVTSFSYAGDKNRQLTRYSDTRWHEDSVRNRWFSVMAGPSVRVNEWFSAYAMAGVAYSRVSTFSGDYIRVTDNKGKARCADRK